MTLTITLAPEIESRLKTEAAREGIDEAEYAKRIIERNLPGSSPKFDQATLDLLAAWDEEDATDDPAEIERRRVEWEEFRQMMNEDSISGRQIYP